MTETGPVSGTPHHWRLPSIERPGEAGYPGDRHGPAAQSRYPPSPEPYRPPASPMPGGLRAGPPAAGGPPSAAGPPDAPLPPDAGEPEEGPEAIAGRQVARGLSLGFGRGSHRERELVRHVSVPVVGTKRIVVVSIKGGVGKTTTVAVVGSLLAALRRDRVVALDASSDWGTLAARLSVVPRHSLRELAARGRHLVSEQGIRAQLVASPSGLFVVGSDPQSAVSAALTEDEYVRASQLLEYVANVILVDVGAGLQQPFVAAALRACDQLVVVTSATWDAAQSAGAALDWLAMRGYANLVERSVVVLNTVSQPRRRRRSYLTELATDLERRCRVVHPIPFDIALQPGGRILLRKLGAATRLAYLEVAADVMAGAAGIAPTSSAQRAGGPPRLPDPGRLTGTGRPGDLGRPVGSGRSAESGPAGGSGRSANTGRSAGSDRASGPLGVPEPRGFFDRPVERPPASPTPEPLVRRQPGGYWPGDQPARDQPARDQPAEPDVETQPTERLRHRHDLPDPLQRYRDRGLDRGLDR